MTAEMETFTVYVELLDKDYVSVSACLQTKEVENYLAARHEREVRLRMMNFGEGE